MSMSTHWRQAEDQFSIFVEDSTGTIVADVRPPKNIVIPTGVTEAMNEHRARARLIAAAPDMLEALKAVADDSANQPLSMRAMSKVMIAIDKAEGGRCER